MGGECGIRVNLFRLCSGLRVLGYLMLLLVAALISVFYYTVVVVTWGPRIRNGGAVAALAVLVLLLFHVLLVMIIWCYLMVVINDPGSVPENWSLLLQDENPGECSSSALSGHIVFDSQQPSAADIEARPSVRYCNRCQNNKPPRAHHCSVCNRCVLKMDHHCVWVVNCIGARNYKYFLLFLLYTFLETVLDMVVLIPHIVEVFSELTKRSETALNLVFIFLSFVLNLAFALSLLCFVCMHASLLLSNTTSIEIYEKKKGAPWKYDLGRRQNFEQVFGTKKLFWFFPLYAAEDMNNIPALQGLDFPTRSDVEP